MMLPIQRILLTIRDRVWPRRPHGNIALNPKILRTLEEYARREQRTPEDLAKELVAIAIREQQAQEDNWRRWEKLSPREKQVTALICLNYSSRQIAAHLHISPLTVKTHAEHILMKFDVPDRNRLRQLLNGWNFNGWE